MGPMKPWIKKIPPPRTSAAGLLGPDLVYCVSGHLNGHFLVVFQALTTEKSLTGYQLGCTLAAVSAQKNYS